MVREAVEVPARQVAVIHELIWSWDTQAIPGRNPLKSKQQM
jgi:hypothetical protein